MPKSSPPSSDSSLHGAWVSAASILLSLGGVRSDARSSRSRRKWSRLPLILQDRDHVCSTFGGTLYCSTPAQRGSLTHSFFYIGLLDASLVFAWSGVEEERGACLSTPRREDACASQITRSWSLLFAVTASALGMSGRSPPVCATSQ